MYNVYCHLGDCQLGIIEQFNLKKYRLFKCENEFDFDFV